IHSLYFKYLLMNEVGFDVVPFCINLSSRQSTLKVDLYETAVLLEEVGKVIQDVLPFQVN
ncbi:MAG: hypothetical protein ACLTMV_12525, partial [Thomasclavelia spiroformis]